ncbi:acyl carrier protein [Cellulosilyticum ruminicola]|uniref:acyl carrier protein n=1 Tax=Cellulosilyticum ruminicola TaxID=425254 RepID=UPI0006D2577C|nr:phosphopantetheine-binding protein [Cellulosilyticum ruminicola]
MNKRVDDELKKLIMSHARIGMCIEDIEDDADLIDDFLFDSIQVLRLIVSIENEFDIYIGDEKELFEMVTNYGRLRKYIEEKVEAHE